MNQFKRQSVFILALLIVLVGAALRFHQLGVQSLWNDEGTAYVQATRTFADIAANAGRDIHPPGYYWLLAVWRMLTGESEFALRAFSALASVLSVALTFALGKRLYGGTAGLAAAAFVALNTFSIYYAQEARMYALLALWGAAAMWAFVGFVQCPEWRWALALALLNAAGLYTHYAFPAVMVVQGILFVLVLAAGMRARSVGTVALLAKYIAANLLTIALFTPWLPTAYTQLTTWPSTGDPIPFNAALTQIVGWFTFGITYTQSGSTVAVAFFLLFGLLSFPEHDGERTWWRMLVPVLWVVVPLGGFFALELFRPANLKFLLPAQIGYALWLGRGAWVLWTLRTRRTAPLLRAAPKLAAVVGSFALLVATWEGVAVLYTDPAYRRDDYQGIAAAISADPTEDKAVIVNAPGQVEVFSYYYNAADHVYPLPVGMTVDREATTQQVETILDDYERIYAVLWGTDERDPERVVENTLNTLAYQVDDRWFGNVRLVRYVTFDDLGEPVESGTQFGEHIMLETTALNSTTLQAGDALLLELQWRTDTLLEARYKVFVQLLDENGVLALQRDSEPASGTAPTTTWEPGRTVTDRHALIIPYDLPPSQYSLIIGLYNPDSSQARLSVGNADYLLVDEITVTGA